VVGAGSFGTAVALVLVRAGIRTTLLCRTSAQAETLGEARQNERYLAGVALPRELAIRAFGERPDQFARPDLIFLAVPSNGLGEALGSSSGWGCPSERGSSRSRRGSCRPMALRRPWRSKRPSGPRHVSRLEDAMKPDIHPDYGPSHVRCTCGNEFWTRSTKPELHVEICSNCHPFYTGRQKLVDTGGRVERFRRRAARSRSRR